MTNREANRTLAAIAGVAILAGPRRTRPLSGLLYGLLLSRAHGASVRRVERTITSLFSQRTSAHERIRSTNHRIDGCVVRLEALEACFGGDPRGWAREQGADGGQKREPAPSTGDGS